MLLYLPQQKCHPNRIVLDKGRTDNLNYKFNIPKEDEICVGITTNPMACEEKHASKEEYKHLSPPLGNRLYALCLMLIYYNYVLYHILCIITYK